MPLVAEVRCEFGQLHVRTRDEAYSLPLATMALSLGGASGHMVFCRAPLHGVIVCVEDDEFVASLRDAAGGALDAACAALVTEKRKWYAWQWATGLVLLLVLAFFVSLGSLATRAAMRLPVSVDRSVGDAAIHALLANEAENNDPAIRHAIGQMIARLEPHARTRGLDFRFHIVESDAVNAFALPGGRIVVYTGLLRQATQPEQVAGVLAHEMSHAALRHGLRAVARSIGVRYSLSLLLGDATGLIDYARSGAVIAVIQGYSRDQEREADAEGVRMMRAAGVDPRGLAEFFARMKRDPDARTPGVMQWLSSHPDHDERIRNVRELSRGAPENSTPPLAIDWSAVQARLNPSASAPQK